MQEFKLLFLCYEYNVILISENANTPIVYILTSLCEDTFTTFEKQICAPDFISE